MSSATLIHPVSTHSYTTLANMFPISYNTLYPQLINPPPSVFSTIEPGEVSYPSTTNFNYTGLLSLTDLNTELNFIAASSRLSSVNNISFTGVTLDSSSERFYIQNIDITGSLTIDSTTRIAGGLSLFGLTVQGSLTVEEPSVSDLEISTCTVIGTMTIPSTNLTSLLLHGSYNKISYSSLLVRSIYPNLTSLFYFNEVDGLSEINAIPNNFTGFGSLRINLDSSLTYPSITSYASPNPFDQISLFPNLNTLMIIESTDKTITVPESSTSSYRSLSVIGGSQLTSVDLSKRINYLHGVRITHCPLLNTLLVNEGTVTNFRAEYCALLYMPGYDKMDWTNINATIRNHSLNTFGKEVGAGSRVLDVIGGVKYVLPNVLASTNLYVPMLITTKFIYSVNSGLQPVIYNNTSVNPLIPGIPSQLSTIDINESRYGLNYSISTVSPISSSTIVTSLDETSYSSLTTSSNTKGRAAGETNVNVILQSAVRPVVISVVVLTFVFLAVYLIVRKRRRETGGLKIHQTATI